MIPKPSKYYRNVPPEQLEALVRFRAGHLPKHLQVQDANWSFLAGGRGNETIVFLPGGLGLAEAWFQLITAFESDYRCLAVSYPPVSTMKELVDGLAAILESEGIRRAHLLGASMGGMLAQCFVRRHPERIDRLILANTSAPDQAAADGLERHNQSALRWPMGLLRWGAGRSLDKHLASLPEGKRAFWKAYFRESIATQWDRQGIACEGKCVVDYARHYSFHRGELAGREDRLLIIESDDDLAISMQARTALRNLYPGAHVHTFHAAGHIPLLSHQEEYAVLIRQFIRPEGGR